VEKLCRAGQAIDDNMAHALCMLGDYGYNHALGICNTYCFSMATMIAPTCRIVTRYACCLSVILSSLLRLGLVTRQQKKRPSSYEL
jgi:hypothetical protein